MVERLLVGGCLNVLLVLDQLLLVLKLYHLSHLLAVFNMTPLKKNTFNDQIRKTVEK